MKVTKTLLLPMLIAAACLALPRDAAAVGGPPAVGTIESITSQNIHDFFFTSVKLSSGTAYGNCGAGVRDAWIPKKWPNGTLLLAHDAILNLAMAAQLSGKPVMIWHENMNYTVSGSSLSYCVITQLDIGP